ncbi:MAG: deoxyribonuclease IV [Fusobacteriaceae bacterium]|nr:deoxyribonuclease IV [Fusobacteriaceae bacterium]MBP6467829.1 deoxyribonuclease IV [Fusobacteriaceae bacterium]MBP9595965.1 deoxyribonuclease IV [Fusobacteriaceae bacterium]MBU9917717.1 deoxyribonuclease IV [Fusobacteriaceae bacterium]
MEIEEKIKIRNKRIGAHVSITGGIENAPYNAREIGAKAFALFTKNQRRWTAKDLEEKNILEFKRRIEEIGIEPKYILPHDSYLINLGNADEEKRNQSFEAFVDEMKRCNELGLLYLNMHPGSHLKEISEEQSMDLIIDCINKAHELVPNVNVVLEITAGQGSNLGYTFEHLAYIINGTIDKNRIGVCLDTCHMFAAGYDIRTKDSYTKTMNSFEEIVGFKYLKGVHLNDSMVPLASKKDRHESIGKGELGLEFFELLMNDERFDDIPIVLETIDETIWKNEIEYLYSLIK